MKFCIDCKHSVGSLFLECHHPRNTKLDYSTGKRKLKWKHCSVVREDDWFTAILFNSCGRKARWFEPRERNI